jgi:hypothetical protein
MKGNAREQVERRAKHWTRKEEGIVRAKQEWRRVSGGDVGVDATVGARPIV